MSHFSAFADFVLKEQSLMAEMAEAYLALCRENNLPLLIHFSHLTEEEQNAYCHKSITDFLKVVKNGTALTQAFATIDRWRANQHPLIPTTGITVSDVVLLYSIQKQLYLNFLPRYTGEISLYHQIVLELENFHRQLEQYAFQVFIETQQASLKQEKELSENIINNCTDGIMAFDSEQRIIVWNKSLEQRYEKKKEDVIGKKLFEVYPDLKDSQLEKNLAKALGGERIFIEEQPNLYRHGWYEAYLIPLLDKSQLPYGAVSIVHDITQWKDSQLKLKEQHEEILASNEELLEKQNEINDAYEKLKEQEHFIQQITDAVPSTIFIYDLPENKIIYTSKEVTNLLGYTPDEILNFGSALYSQLVPPEDQHIISEKNMRYQEMKEGETAEVVYRNKTKEGKYKFVRSKSRIYKFSPEGKPLQVLGILEDVTDKVKQEIELRQSRDYYLTILEDFPSLIWRANTEGLCDYFNKTWLEFRGRTLEQEWGTGWAEGVHPDDFERCLEIYNTNFRARKAFVMEYRMLRYDGEYRWIIDHGTPLHDVQGNFTGFLGACFDIQERKDFENNIQSKNRALSEAQEQLVKANETLEQRVQQRTEQLESGEKQLRLLTNALPSCISYVDKDEIYRFVNHTYTVWFGMPKAEIEGRHIKEIIGEEVYKKLEPNIKKVLSGREVKAEGKMAYKYGGTKNVATNLIPYIEQGEVKGFYGFVYDVSEIRKTQESLETALSDITLTNEQLSKINNDLDSFVYTASHDLRNPVVNLEGLLMALKKRLSSVKNRDLDQLVNMMETSVNKLNQTIRDLTEITKAQKGLEEPEEEISIIEKLEDIKAELQETIQQSNPIIREDLEVTSLTYARRNLRSILYNLLTNALKYKSEDRRLEIDIKTYEEDEWVVLSVQDNGLGLSEQQRLKLFTMFKRLHTHVEGTGIGLYIIKRIVENNGGKIEVSSQPNVGSTFRVYLRKNAANG
ncbi:sensor histidine kinase response regulator, Cache_1, HAMP, PAS, PAS, PAS, PAS and PAS domain-containing [Flammeovirgaceae bacterium 311]|nr:sensor histidine kinase response regulator, Cache_1, HAMP, PAS, PAS, PAS, PAS and PAS domain-containing [Flammeovirgaceae bacterium 311]